MLEVFKKFSDALIVEGYNRSTIIDLTRKDYYFIPCEWGRFIEFFEGKAIIELESSAEQSSEIQEMYQFLLEKELFFITKYPERFPAIDLVWKNPSIITNIVWDYSDAFKSQVLDLVEVLNIKAMHLRFTKYETLEVIQDMMLYFEYSGLKTIEVSCNFDSKLTIEMWAELVKKHQRLTLIIVFSSPQEKIEFFDNQKQHAIIQTLSKMHFTHDVVKSNVHPASFRVNHELFIESNSYNSYTNGKLYLNNLGQVTSCVEDENIFFSMSDKMTSNSIKSLLSSEEFRSVSNVSKSLLDICRHCEFRHMCVDNRLPYKRSKNEWYHKIECNYNPYICKWRGEEGYLTLAECGVVSNEHGFSIDHDKIAAINKELWGEE